jgi:hypothetical protein
MPRMPRAASDDETDWVTGWFHERLLDSLFEDRADDQERPEYDAGQTGRAE